ncbi:hypothetical protein SNOG_10814 [Parastagonospora nodorum SN15]|uniref:Uncharacterized protein n=1 Tax=Phaeosphaeria nodorum (strain SN15 / ATCC MYA-4574 / FGSC 10173) TaxID=321614 RepID=Q0UBQ0_PHANO|nr:hypothetical protein SNOG_10814 [Parastagonospora nodorum SN15]EAT82208.1 hypothetical protein SNOG_10814 [Parastagonospora nodorum SN15]
MAHEQESESEWEEELVELVSKEFNIPKSTPTSRNREIGARGHETHGASFMAGSNVPGQRTKVQCRYNLKARQKSKRRAQMNQECTIDKVPWSESSPFAHVEALEDGRAEASRAKKKRPAPDVSPSLRSQSPLQSPESKTVSQGSEQDIEHEEKMKLEGDLWVQVMEVAKEWYKKKIQHAQQQ